MSNKVVIPDFLKAFHVVNDNARNVVSTQVVDKPKTVVSESKTIKLIARNKSSVNVPEPKTPKDENSSTIDVSELKPRKQIIILARNKPTVNVSVPKTSKDESSYTDEGTTDEETTAVGTTNEGITDEETRDIENNKNYVYDHARNYNYDDNDQSNVDEQSDEQSDEDPRDKVNRLLAESKIEAQVRNVQIFNDTDEAYVEYGIYGIYISKDDLDTEFTIILKARVLNIINHVLNEKELEPFSYDALCLEYPIESCELEDIHKAGLEHVCPITMDEEYDLMLEFYNQKQLNTFHKNLKTLPSARSIIEFLLPYAKVHFATFICKGRKRVFYIRDHSKKIWNELGTNGSDLRDFIFEKIHFVLNTLINLNVTEKLKMAKLRSRLDTSKDLKYEIFSSICTKIQTKEDIHHPTNYILTNDGKIIDIHTKLVRNRTIRDISNRSVNAKYLETYKQHHMNSILLFFNTISDNNMIKRNILFKLMIFKISHVLNQSQQKFFDTFNTGEFVDVYNNLLGLTTHNKQNLDMDTLFTFLVDQCENVSVDDVIIPENIEESSRISSLVFFNTFNKYFTFDVRNKSPKINKDFCNFVTTEELYKLCVDDNPEYKNLNTRNFGKLMKQWENNGLKQSRPRINGERPYIWIGLTRKVENL